MELKLALGLIVVILLSGCGGGGSGPQTTEFVDVAPPVEAVTVYSGWNYDCIVRNASASGIVYCRDRTQVHSNSVAVGSNSFIPFVTDTNSPIREVRFLDSTVCVEVDADTTWNVRQAGLGTYCMGYANLAGSYSGIGANGIIFGGPNYDPALHGSADLTFAQVPYMAGDGLTLTMIFDQAAIMVDGSASVSQQTIQCENDGTSLICPSFTVVLQ